MRIIAAVHFNTFTDIIFSAPRRRTTVLFTVNDHQKCLCSIILWLKNGLTLITPFVLFSEWRKFDLTAQCGAFYQLGKALRKREVASCAQLSWLSWFQVQQKYPETTSGAVNVKLLSKSSVSVVFLVDLILILIWVEKCLKISSIRLLGFEKNFPCTAGNHPYSGDSK